jgi:hypothetical protein
MTLHPLRGAHDVDAFRDVNIAAPIGAGHNPGHNGVRCTRNGRRGDGALTRISKQLVPEEGIEPSRGVTPTGF